MDDKDGRRTCIDCEAQLPERDFPARGNRCLACRRSYGRRHYRENQEYYVAKARARRVTVIAQVRDWLRDYLVANPCVDCGETDIRTLEFDHRDGAMKTAPVAVLARGGYSLDRVRAEIEQCDVRCANCHRIRTHRQRGWWGSFLVATPDP